VKEIHIVIDGNSYKAEEGMTILEVLKQHGFKIPTLCYHKALRPIGACKLCAVEVTSKGGKSRVMLSCILKAKEALSIATDSAPVLEAREKAMQRLLSLAPQAKRLRQIAEEFNIPTGPIPDGCVRCRLCIRVCAEVVGAGALKMEKRDGTTYVVPMEGLCIGCGTCANICPTDTIHLVDEEGIRTITIRDETIGIHPLMRCESCGRYFASQKFLAHVSEATSPHVDIKEHHRYCPTCSKLFSDRAKSSTRFRRM
jgi:bidirectional [NiFe] hydrogenase diaphorase subunit